MIKIILLSILNIFMIIENNILISLLININPSTIMLFNGIGTLIYLIITKNKIPIFLGSNMLFWISIIPLIKLYKYENLFSRYILCGIIFYIFSYIFKNINFLIINKILPSPIIGTTILIICIEFIKYLFYFFNKKINSKYYLLIILIFLSIFFIKILFNNYIISKIPISIIIVIYFIINKLFINKDINKKELFNINNINYIPFFSLPKLYKYNLNIKYIFNIIPITIILIIKHICYIFILSNMKNDKTFKKINKSLFCNSISIIISGLFGSIPNTICEENIKILNIKKKRNKYNLLITSIMLIILSFINKINIIIKSIPNYIIFSISIYFLYIYFLNSIKFLIKFNKFKKLKNIFIILFMLFIYIKNIEINVLNIFYIEKIFLSFIIGILINLLYIYFIKFNKIFNNLIR